MFDSREHAGMELAQTLHRYANDKPIVYALPRGGLPVAAAVADALDAPLDLILVRKIGAPGHQELAIGAVVDGAAPTLILHKDIIRDLGVDKNYIERANKSALAEIERRREIFFKGRDPISPEGRTVIIVDDGLATGATMQAAVQAIRKAGPRRLIIAVPVAPADTIAHLRNLADEIVCLEIPTPFWSVGGHYLSFPQLKDDDVVRCLENYEQRDIRTIGSEKKTA